MNAHADGPSPLSTGIMGRCPRCGEGHLFKGFLTIAPFCDACGLDYGYADSGDGPAVLIMFPAGTFIIVSWLISDALFGWPVLVHLGVWMPLTLILSLALLRPLKGVIVNLQYKSGVRAGGGAGEQDRN